MKKQSSTVCVVLSPLSRCGSLVDLTPSSAQAPAAMPQCCSVSAAGLHSDSGHPQWHRTESEVAMQAVVGMD
eukprot:285934-Hanusia_phi.AAC.1